MLMLLTTGAFPWLGVFLDQNALPGAIAVAATSGLIAAVVIRRSATFPARA